MKFNFPLKTIMVLTILTWASNVSAASHVVGAGYACDPFNDCGHIGPYPTNLENAVRHHRIGEDQLRAEHRAMGFRADGPYSCAFASACNDHSMAVLTMSDGSQPNYLFLTPEAREYAITYLEEWATYYSGGGSDMSDIDGPRMDPENVYRWAGIQSQLYQLRHADNRHDTARAPNEDWTIVGVQQNGIETTIYCREPCTLGNVRRHARISGRPRMVPATLLASVEQLRERSPRLQGAWREGAVGDSWDVAAGMMRSSEVRSSDRNAYAANDMDPITVLLAAASYSARQQNPAGRHNSQMNSREMMRSLVNRRNTPTPTAPTGPGYTDTTTADTDTDTTTADTDTTTADTETTAVLPPNCTREYEQSGGYDINC